jgi:hypothetical protein
VFVESAPPLRTRVLLATMLGALPGALPAAAPPLARGTRPAAATARAVRTVAPASRPLGVFRLWRARRAAAPGAALPPARASRSGVTTTASGGGDPALSVSINNASDAKSTVVSVKASNRPGVLHAITTTFKDLALNVNKAEVDMDGDLLAGARRGVASPLLEP